MRKSLGWMGGSQQYIPYSSWLTLSGTIATVAFAVAGQSYMSFAYGQIIAALISTAMAIGLAPHHARVKVGFDNWRDVHRFSINVLATLGISRVFSRLQDMALACWGWPRSAYIPGPATFSACCGTACSW
jgi:hypothetical protein